MTRAADLLDFEDPARKSAPSSAAGRHGDFESASPSVGLWIVVVIASLVAGGFAAYYLISI